MNVVNIRRATMNDQRRLELEQLLASSITILAQAKEGAWIEAVALQRQRRLRMDAFFKQSCPADESSEVAKVIEEILDIDKSVAELLYAERGKLSADSELESKNVRNLGSYLSNS